MILEVPIKFVQASKTFLLWRNPASATRLDLILAIKAQRSCYRSVYIRNLNLWGWCTQQLQNFKALHYTEQDKTGVNSPGMNKSVGASHKINVTRP